jgi:glutathione S-transferase
MKLHWSPRSPFVRKVMIVARETGLIDRIDCVRTRVAMVEPNLALLPDNPLSKIPTLVLEDGSAIYDSRVICDYLDTLHSGQRLIPSEPRARLQVLCRQALADGFLDALLLWRNERDRPEERRSQPHLAAFRLKKDAVLDRLERDVAGFADLPFDLAHIATGCTLSYMDFRFPDENWRDGHPALAKWHEGFEARPSVLATPVIDG